MYHRKKESNRLTARLDFSKSKHDSIVVSPCLIFIAHLLQYLRFVQGKQYNDKTYGSWNAFSYVQATKGQGR